MIIDAHTHPNNCHEDKARDIDECLELDPGYEPFYPHDKRCRVIFEPAMEFGVPVMIHSGDTCSPTG